VIRGSFEHWLTDRATFHVSVDMRTRAFSDLKLGIGRFFGGGGSIPIVANGTNRTTVIRIKRSTEFTLSYFFP
jgi:hypothetical protein